MGGGPGPGYRGSLRLALQDLLVTGDGLRDTSEGALTPGMPVLLYR